MTGERGQDQSEHSGIQSDDIVTLCRISCHISGSESCYHSNHTIVMMLVCSILNLRMLHSLEGRKGGRKEGSKGGREEGKEGGRKGGREGGREEGRKEGREGGREEGREGGREDGREGGREGGREERREG